MSQVHASDPLYQRRMFVTSRAKISEIGGLALLFVLLEAFVLLTPASWGQGASVNPEVLYILRTGFAIVFGPCSSGLSWDGWSG